MSLLKKQNQTVVVITLFVFLMNQRKDLYKSHFCLSGYLNYPPYILSNKIYSYAYIYLSICVYISSAMSLSGLLGGHRKLTLISWLMERSSRESSLLCTCTLNELSPKEAEDNRCMY